MTGCLHIEQGEAGPEVLLYTGYFIGAKSSCLKVRFEDMEAGLHPPTKAVKFLEFMGRPLPGIQ